MEIDANINKLSVNVIGYAFTFLEHNDIITCSKVNKKFRRALNSEILWENLTLRDELFAQNEGTTWKKYYFNLLTLKKNFKSGKSNTSFKMKPMRGHPNYITNMTYYEDLPNNFSTVISGDIDGNVFHWVINEDGDYESVKLIKMDAEIINLRYILPYNHLA